MVICDTSGRLHTNYRLMEELAKCHRAIQKKVRGAPSEVLLVLDGTTGSFSHATVAIQRRLPASSSSPPEKSQFCYKRYTRATEAHNAGLNMANQAREFNDMVPVSGLVLTKLDGTARGGAVVGAVDELKLPIKFVGVGETVDDLQPFDAEAFVEGLFPEGL